MLSAEPTLRPRPRSPLEFVHESVIAATPERVFAFHESPEALTLLIPPWEKMRVSTSSGSLLPGSRVVLEGRAGLIPVRWVAIHTEYDPPRLFADQQVSGPFAYWYHRHECLPAPGNQTLLRDHVEYLPPLGFLGRLIAGPLIRKKLTRMFTYRHEVTRKAVQATATR